MPDTMPKPGLSLRPMTEQDLAMLHEWLHRPHILTWWGGDKPSLAEVRAEYLPHIQGLGSVTPYIVMLGSRPIGYAQSYVAMGSGDGWWEDETDPGVRGIDQSIAEPELLGQGLGTQLVRTLVEHLFQDASVTKVQTDPSPMNLRAVRCYQKAGFRIVGPITTPDGPALYMIRDRSNAS